MRVSVYPCSPGGAIYKLLLEAGREIAVYLDGIRQYGLVSADEEGREVVRKVFDADGAPKISGMGAFITEAMRGRVRIEIERKP